MNTNYSQIGHILKSSRKKKGISLEKISNKTKISIQNLYNIEEGDFHLIAGKFYQKSFIKSYAKALRISEKKILQIFDSGSVFKDVKNENEVDNDRNLKKYIINEKIPTVPLMVFASLGLFLFFIADFIKAPVDEGGNLAVIAPKTGIEIEKIKENYTEDVTSIKRSANINLNEIDEYKTDNTATLLNQIIAKDDVWIEIKDINENILLSAILKKNEFFNLPNNKEDIIISTSNAGAIFLKNGNTVLPELGLFGTSIDSVKLDSLITNH